MKLLILGADGMLGHKLFQRLRVLGYDVYGTISENMADVPWCRIPFFRDKYIFPGVDAMDFCGLQKMIRKVEPDYVINCLRVAVHGNEVAPPIRNITVNSLLPHRLAELTAELSSRLIHFSSDCVFDGKRGMYTEDDVPNATHAYGQSRLLGEVRGDHVLVLRGSVIGRELKGSSSLLEWFLLQRGLEIRGFTNAIYSGLSSIETANLVHWVLEKTPALSGLYNVASEPINKYELLCLARDSFGVDIAIRREEGIGVDRSLNAGKFMTATGYKAPSWSPMMSELAEENELYKEWR